MASKRTDENTLNQPTDRQSAPSSGNNNSHSSNSNNNGKPESLWNRIQTSATTLMQDAVTRPSGAALGADLAQALNDNSKGSAYSSSFSSSSSLGQSQSTYSGVSNGSLSSFRSGSTGNTVQESEGFGFDQDSFQDHYEEYPDIYESQGKKKKGKGKGKGSPVQNQQQPQTDNITMMMNMQHFSDYEMAWINATRSDAGFSTTSADNIKEWGNTQQQQNLYKEEETDGDAVVSLLSDPFFQPGYMPINDNNDPPFFSWNDYDKDMTMTDDGYLTADEIKMIDSFRLQSEQQQQQQSQPARITSKSLIPDIDMFLAQNDNTDATTSSLRDNVLSHLPGAEDWVRVDERYHDEVWGYLRPALEAAATELEEKKDDVPSQGGDGDGPAVRRLKMILRHMTM